MTVRPRRYCGWVTTSQNAIKPPVAKRVDSIRTVHGDEYNDVYAWLAHKDDPDTIALLEAENAYTEQETAHLAQLREDLFNEVKARTQETDLSLPVRKGGFWYYTRTVEGQQYGIHCRVAAGESTEPPASINLTSAEWWFAKRCTSGCSWCMPWGTRASVERSGGRDTCRETRSPGSPRATECSMPWRRRVRCPRTAA